MLPWLLLDTPRYGLGSIAVCFGDAFKSALPRNMRNDNKRYHRPLVCAILAGLNEAETVGATLESVLGSYPNLEVIVVDDGSTDGMSNVAPPDNEISLYPPEPFMVRSPARSIVEMASLRRKRKRSFRSVGGRVSIRPERSMRPPLVAVMVCVVSATT